MRKPTSQELELLKNREIKIEGRKSQTMIPSQNPTSMARRRNETIIKINYK